MFCNVQIIFFKGRLGWQYFLLEWQLPPIRSVTADHNEIAPKTLRVAKTWSIRCENQISPNGKNYKSISMRTIRVCDGYIMDVATLRHYKASFATRWAWTHNLWLAKRDHYQLRQRKASYSLTWVAHDIPVGVERYMYSYRTVRASRFGLWNCTENTQYKNV